LYPDLDNEHYGQSILDSLVIDAISDYAMSNRELYFYMNNATPSTVYILDNDIEMDAKSRIDLEQKINEKF
jgi:hypothetical protein